MKKLLRNQRGFTLIELLIVIAVLGVLATVVLVAIDPLEQLARGRDSGRESDISQLGHAMESFVTGSSTATYPAYTATWMTNLQTAGEIKNILNETASPLGTCPAGNMQTGSNVCYVQLGGGTGGVIWTIMESKSSKNKAGCTGTQVPAAEYSSTQGKAGVTCLAGATTVPNGGETLK